jgi:hypothetical protein
LEFIKILFDEIIMFEKNLTIYIIKKMAYAEPDYSGIENVEAYDTTVEGIDQELQEDRQELINIEDRQEDQDYDIVDKFSIEDMDVEFEDEDNLYKDVLDKMS